VLGLDLQNRRVQVHQKGNRKNWWEAFDQLMIATGAVPIWPQVSGADARGIYGVNTLQSGEDLRRLILEKKPKRGVVVGGGYIGLEMAEALTLRGLEVSLVELADEVMATLDPDMGHLVSEALMKIGVSLYRKDIRCPERTCLRCCDGQTNYPGRSGCVRHGGETQLIPCRGSRHIPGCEGIHPGQ